MYVAIDNIQPDDFFADEVCGLGMSRSPSDSGYLMFIQKRAGNEASNQRLHSDYDIKEIKQADEIYKEFQGAE